VTDAPNAPARNTLATVISASSEAPGCDGPPCLDRQPGRWGSERLGVGLSLSAPLLASDPRLWEPGMPPSGLTTRPRGGMAVTNAVFASGASTGFGAAGTVACSFTLVSAVDPAVGQLHAVGMMI